MYISLSLSILIYIYISRSLSLFFILYSTLQVYVYIYMYYLFQRRQHPAHWLSASLQSEHNALLLFYIMIYNYIDSRRQDFRCVCLPGPMASRAANVATDAAWVMYGARCGAVEMKVNTAMRSLHKRNRWYAATSPRHHVATPPSRHHNIQAIERPPMFKFRMGLRSSFE